MSTLSELLEKKKTLPSGNVYSKKINGGKYFYYQYFENGKRYSSIVSPDQAKELIALIQERKEIENLIKNKLSSEKKIVLSKNAINLTGYVMSNNDVVAEFENGTMISINEKLAPLVIARTHSLEKFLSLRVIDMSRTNARILKKALNLTVDEEYKIPLYAYALSITDNYWFKPKHSKIKYSDIILNNDDFAEVSLKGDTAVFPCEHRLTPEITTTGSFEKGWKLIKNTWWLYKNGNAKQLFSELFCYEFAKLIKIPTAKYELDNKYIRSENFAKEYNFEPIAALADDNDNYEHVFNIVYAINKNIAKSYLKLIFFDSVVNNIDRHNENVGLLRDKETGDIVSLAPNFDNNLALISNTDSLKSPKDDAFMKLFINFLKNNKTAMELFKTICWKDIEIESLYDIVNKIPLEIDNKKDIAEKIYLRYKYIKRAL